jgi:holo-[acyl-carrier protein] synthase
VSPVVGVGVDAVDVARFRRVLDRRPSVASRCFTSTERSDASGSADAVQSLGAALAAQEAG